MRVPSQFQFWLVVLVLCCYGAAHCPAAAAPDGLKRHSGVPHWRGLQAIPLSPWTDAGSIVTAAMFVAIAKHFAPLTGNG
ncbi:hypothetical protein D3C71_1119970 [compost metagenome]